MTKIKTVVLNEALQSTHRKNCNESIKTCDSWDVTWITESVHNVVIYNDILSTSVMRENGIDVGDFSADM